MAEQKAKVLIRDASGKFRNPSTDEGKEAVDNLLEWLYESTIAVKTAKEDIMGLIGTMERGDNPTTGKPVKTLNLRGVEWVSTVTFADEAKVETPKGVKKGDAMVRIAKALEDSGFGQYVKVEYSIKPGILEAAEGNPDLLMILNLHNIKRGESKSIGTPEKKVNSKG